MVGTESRGGLVVGELRMTRLKICHASFGLFAFFSRAFVIVTWVARFMLLANVTVTLCSLQLQTAVAGQVSESRKYPSSATKIFC